MARLLLVVPCYNEAARLDGAAFLSALQSMSGLRLCFVDDGSTDDTGKALQHLQRAAPDRVEILSMPHNAGKGAAVRFGLLHACAAGNESAPEFCGFWDADLSAPLSEVPELLAVFERVPTVHWSWGIRLRALGRDITRGWLRHYLGRGFATAASAVLGLGCYDTQCGAKLFRCDALLREVLSEPFLSRWLFDVEMLSRLDQLSRAAGRGGAATLVYERPLMRYHHQGGSKVQASDFLRSMRDLVAIRRTARRWNRPMPAAQGRDVPPAITVST